jgi:hypothetical protein
VVHRHRPLRDRGERIAGAVHDLRLERGVVERERVEIRLDPLAQVRLVDGVNPQTVWTWNAIGKRRGAWTLKDGAPESEKAFLLNHAISEFLPADASGRSRSNTDPITGQAAWFDLRVRVTKCAPAEAGVTAPQCPPLPLPPGIEPSPATVKFGSQFRSGREVQR